MANEKDFEVTWEADDGYCGGSAPQRFTIHAEDLDSGMDEADLRRLFWEEIEADFEQKVHYVCDQEDEFLEWAKAIIAERLEE